ncbi:MAG: hypothetical protein ACP5IL_16940 [Syntrophobacteraceae bacterium]
MEKIRASYEISERPAILAGKSEYGKIILDVDPSCLTPEQREELISCPKSGGIFQLDGPVDSLTSLSDPPFPEFCERNPDAVAQLLDHRRHVRETRRMRTRAEAKTYASKISDYASWITATAAPTLADICSDLNDILDGLEGSKRRAVPGNYLRVEEPYVPSAIKKYVYALVNRESVEEQARAAVDAHNKTEADKVRPYYEKIIERLRAERIAESEKAARRKAQITDWVTEYGTENQKKRFSVGLLAEDEILDGIRSLAFAPIADFPKFRKLKSEFCECYEPELDFKVEDSESATAEEYEFLLQIQELLPRATLVLRTHTGVCNQCSATASRKSLRVELTFGEFNFSRELAIPTEE